MPTWLWVIASIYGAIVFVFGIWTWDKPFWFNYRERRIPVRAPLLRFLMIMGMAAFALVSIPVHILCQAVDRRGFWDRNAKTYGTQNPFRRT